MGVMVGVFDDFNLFCGDVTSNTRLIQALHAFDLTTVWDALQPLMPLHPQTRSNYYYTLKRYLSFAQQVQLDVLHPTPDQLRAFLTTLEGLNPQHVRTLLSRLRGLYQALRTLGVIPSTYDPLLGLHGPALEQPPGEGRRFYLQTEIARLSAEADVDDRCLLLLGAHAGLKTGEVLVISWPDIQLMDATLHIRNRFIPKSGDLEHALLAWARRHGGLLAEGRLFAFKDHAAVNARLHRLCTATNVDYRPWSALRSSYALRLWQATHDPAIMTRQLGLNSLKAVQAYQKMEDALTRTMDAALPSARW
ncbi:site-specific integrase (plasmid) [Deinococcus sp. KNUC1210]|uniref:site-specific integrase n=1 Tax=Deinococcus sp. KNUC1210 TaxID=2917691 RepID=UPI001EF0A975|nr:site-specific integrase [Deinococcus sp. KNUC1210]ULH14010.1 site-specific integrase [Deinococcus sp. KNUC1210]